MTKVPSARSIPRKRRRIISLDKKKARTGWLFVLPFVIGFAIIYLPIIIDSITYSFCQITYLKNGFKLDFVGFANYHEALTENTEFVKTLMGGIEQMLFDIPAIVIFSLFMAVLLNKKMFGRAAFRAIFFIPVILAGVIMSYLFSQDVGSVSVFSSLLTEATGSNWIAMIFGGGLSSQIGSIMWKSSVEILIFLAALQSVPDILYEVVELDGATAWESFWHITLPYISPFVILNAVYALVDSFVDSSNPVMGLLTNLTTASNGESYYGLASALSWVYMLMALLTILIFVLLTRRWLK